MDIANKITAINKDAVHRICSGQVVLNLAIAVKELIENSLDAAATIVEVRLKEFGSELIEVSDNGQGIHPADFEALALKHHTSKIRDFADLVDVETFGFRGEALSSLCAVGEMVVTTKHISEDCGSKLKFDHRGILTSKQPFPRQMGTTVSVSNLFASLPVRQKEFHRNVKREFSKCVQILSAYCLISNNVKISCVNQTKKGGKTTFLATQENKTIRENISCVFGSKVLSNLLEIKITHLDDEIAEEYGIQNADSETFKLEGYISSCEHGNGRSTTDRQFYFINSRPCEPTKVMKLVIEIYHRYNPHQYPFVLLNIIVPKESVDVNVTPDKRLIFLENEKLLLACVKSTLIKLFETIPSTYKINTPLSLKLKEDNSSNAKDEVTSKSVLFNLSKWKHASDKTTHEPTTNTTQKRCLSQSSCQIASNPKQIKLDQIFKITTLKESTICERNDLEKVTLDSIKCITTKSTKETREFTNTSHDLIVGEFMENLKKDSSERIYGNDTKPETEIALASEDSSVEFEEENDVIMNDETDVNIVELDSSLERTGNEEIISEYSDEVNYKCVAVEASVSRITEMNDDISEAVVIKTKKQRAVINVNILELRKSLQKRRSLQKNCNYVRNKFHAEIDSSKNEIAEEELKREISKSMFSKMKILGQFNLGFIITKLENDLFIVDQHASDEKYNFETLQRTTTLKSQKLIAPQDLNLTATNECILVDNIDILRKNGFEFLIDATAEATKKVKLISIPVSQNWQFGKEDIDEMLFMLQDAPNTLCRPSRIRAMFASRACRKSVMIGMHLSVSDMRRLINNMGTIEQPWNCPHGRPTMRHLVNLSLLN